MSAGRLIKLYPRAWRERYGAELEALIVETSDGGRLHWRTRVDVASAAARERVRTAGLGRDNEPREQARGGALLVMCAWALFVVAGTVVQKYSEHWQNATPVASRGLPSGAFDALVVAAAVGGLLVLAGIALTLPSLAAFLRAGGWSSVRRRVVIAAGMTVASVAATAGLVAWANGLSAHARDGHDVAYAVGFVAAGLIACACLAAWTIAAVAIARRLDLRPATLRLEARLAFGVTVAMAAMTAATALWWASQANPAVAPQLVVALVAMGVATGLGVAGARTALGAAARI